MKELLVEYDDSEYKINFAPIDMASSFFKVYKYSQAKWQLRFLYCQIRKKMITITIPTEETINHINHFKNIIANSFKSPGSFPTYKEQFFTNRATGNT